MGRILIAVANKFYAVNLKIRVFPYPNLFAKNYFHRLNLHKKIILAITKIFRN